VTCWVTYIQIFELEFVHVPAEKHAAPDGLTRRRRREDDSNKTDDDSDLDNDDYFIAGMPLIDPDGEIAFKLTPSEESLMRGTRLQLEYEELPDLLSQPKTFERLVPARGCKRVWIAITPADLRDECARHVFATITAAETSSDPESDADDARLKEHTHKPRDNDGDEFWRRKEYYSNTLKVPESVSRKNFVQSTGKYFHYDGHI
jgi:hypothetical protein